MVAKNWVTKVVEGGNDGIAQIREAPATKGSKLNDLADGYRLLVDTNNESNGWYMVMKPDGKTMPFPSPNTGENWIEGNNLRDVTVSPPSDYVSYEVEAFGFTFPVKIRKL